MKNIAITGTKGKTTIMYIIQHVLRKLNKNVLSASSTEGVFYNETFLRNAKVSSYLDLTTDYPYDYFLSEATSKLLKIGKYKQKHVDIALYNGIELHEHLETHRTFDNYLNSKKTLFDLISNEGKLAIVNMNDKYHEDILRNYGGEVCYVGVDPKANLCYNIVDQTTMGTKIRLISNIGNIGIFTKLTGMYNVHNTIMAFAALKALKIPIQDIINHIKTFEGVPGRFQKIQLADGRLIIIDYAHSEESLKLVIKHIKNLYPKRPVLTIFGCGGGRTPVKRPLMGKAATKNSNHVYLTNDNPRDEHYMSILLDIKKGITKNNYNIIPDRQEAITIALENNTHQDNIILIAGKGSEVDNIHGPDTFKLTDEQRVNNSITHLNLIRL